MVQRRRIAVIASSRAPVVEPFDGGMSALVWALTRVLDQRGHDVTLFAAPGSDPRLPVVDLAVRRLELSEHARRDVSMPGSDLIADHHAYLSLMLSLSRQLQPFDVVLNHSLHYLPVAMADLLTSPMITTLHTPPTPWLESAVAAGVGTNGRFAAVSRFTAAQWEHALGPVDVIRNGVDCARWAAGPGGRGAVWSGRMTPEKAPHRAVRAARRAGLPITLAGPLTEPGYFADQVQPMLGDDARYVGHLDQGQLCDLIGRSAVLVASPVWDEPFGLVVAEALACGTPVAAFARGGVPEILTRECGRLASPDDEQALAVAIAEAARLDRRAVRRHAKLHCSLDRVVDEYERLLTEVMAA